MTGVFRFFALGLTLSGALAVAPAAVPISSPTPSPQITHIVEPLREIGRVKTQDRFCTQLRAGASSPIAAALLFETAERTALRDIRAFNRSNELSKRRGLVAIEEDLAILTQLARAGDVSVPQLRALAANSDQDLHDELIAMADALSGAKARQYEVARTISRVYGTLAERPVANIVDSNLDDHDPFKRTATAGALPSMQQPVGIDTIHDRPPDWIPNDIFDLSPQDRMIGHDMADVAQHLTSVLSLHACGLIAPAPTTSPSRG